MSKPIGWMVSIGALFLFLCGSLKHGLFQSTAWDLGIFDQAVYLLSQGKPPISSFTNFHILGDHAAFVLYPISLLYAIYPDVHWLLAVQAIALSLGALPTYGLALQAGLKESQAVTMAAVYLLYPLVFNLNLFDFHPDAIALPALLWAILLARPHLRVGEKPKDGELGKMELDSSRSSGFSIALYCLAIAIVLSCKAVLALTVAAMGFWLAIFEKRRLHGGIAIFAGIAWFIVATQVIIPAIGGEGASVGRHLSRYSYLGSSFSEVAANFLLKPQLALGQVFSLKTLEYLALLLSPLIWWLSPQQFSPLVGALPAIAMNILSSDSSQRDIIHQYSLPVLPFLLLVVIRSLKAEYGWIKGNRAIALWALLGFLILSRLHFFAGRYWESVDTWQATREAVALVKTQAPHKGRVLTTAEIAPHLTQRPVVKLAITEPPPTDLAYFKYVLLNVRHPGWLSSTEFASGLVKQFKNAPQFRLAYQKDDVYLFVRQ